MSHVLRCVPHHLLFVLNKVALIVAMAPLQEEERKETLHILNQGPETASLLQSIFDEEVPDVETIDE